MVDRVNKLPKVNYPGQRLKTKSPSGTGSEAYLYNINGDAVWFVKKQTQKNGTFYLKFKSNFNTGTALRNLGIEANAGGGWFLPRAAPIKSFKGKSISEIKAIQKKY